MLADHVAREVNSKIADRDLTQLTRLWMGGLERKQTSYSGGVVWSSTVARRGHIMGILPIKYQAIYGAAQMQRNEGRVNESMRRSTLLEEDQVPTLVDNTVQGTSNATSTGCWRGRHDLRGNCDVIRDGKNEEKGKREESNLPLADGDRTSRDW